MTPGFDKEFWKVITKDGRNVILAEPVIFTHPCGEQFRLEVGMQSDGASSPSLVWGKYPPFGPYWRDTFLHDCLYRYSDFPKDKCDYWFRDSMAINKISETDRLTLYEAVHLFGQSSFDEDRENQMHL